MDAKKYTQAEAKAFCQSLGLTFRKTDANDFRVAYKPAPGESTEASACYADTIEDAIDAAWAMSQHGKQS